MKNFDISRSVRRIGPNAFAQCTELQHCHIPDTVQTIGQNAFAQSGIVCATVPEDASIGDGLFAGCRWLVVATIPESIRVESPFDKDGLRRLFCDCPRLVHVVAPRHILDSSSFTGCPRLTRMTPDSSAARPRAAQLSNWSVTTHRLCRAECRSWVCSVFLVVVRLRRDLRSTIPKLPVELWFAILESIPHWQLGVKPPPLDPLPVDFGVHVASHVSGNFGVDKPCSNETCLVVASFV